MPNNNKDVIGLNREKTFQNQKTKEFRKQYKILKIRFLN